MSWLRRSLSYCRQLAVRLQPSKPSQSQTQPLSHANHLKVQQLSSFVVPLRSCSSSSSSSSPPVKNLPYQFETPSPYKNPGPNRHGYKQKHFDGGRLPRSEDASAIRSLPPYRPKDRWAPKRALFGQNDYIDILSDSNLRPVDLIKGPKWIKGFNGNELQRLVRMMAFNGRKMQQLHPTQYHQTWKRIKFLYKKYNQRRGTRHT